MKKFTLMFIALVGFFALNASAITVDDICGAYNQNLKFTYWGTSGEEAREVTDGCVITKVDDTTVTLENLFGEGSIITGTFDADTNVLSFKSMQDINYAGYSWALYGLSNNAMTALKFSVDTTNGVVLTATTAPTLGLDYYNNGYYYDYTWDATCTLTRVGDITTQNFTAKASADVYNDAGEIAKTLFSGDITISKVNGAYYNFILKNFLGTDSDVKINIDDAKKFSFYGNEYTYNGYTYFYRVASQKDCVGPYYEDGECEFTNEGYDYTMIFAFTYWADTSSDDSQTGYYTINWNEDPAGINAVESNVANAETVYNVAGQKMNNNLQKGIYIKAGKKFVVK